MGVIGGKWGAGRHWEVGSWQTLGMVITRFALIPWTKIALPWECLRAPRKLPGSSYQFQRQDSDQRCPLASEGLLPRPGPVPDFLARNGGERCTWAEDRTPYCLPPPVGKGSKDKSVLGSRKIRSPLRAPSHQASALWPSLLAAGPGGAARLGLLPTAGRRGRAACGSRCRVAMETLPHPDCSWQRGPAARQALRGDPRELARQAAHGAARPPGHRYGSPTHRHPSLILPRHTHVHRRPSCSSPGGTAAPARPAAPTH